MSNDRAVVTCLPGKVKKNNVGGLRGWAGAFKVFAHTLFPPVGGCAVVPLFDYLFLLLVFQACHINDVAVGNVTFGQMCESGIDFIHADYFAYGVDVVLRAEIQHLLRFLDSADQGAGHAAAAIRYALSRLPKLKPYLDDGRLEIDNNTAERAMRPIALGRKNYMFVGSDGGGKAAAILYTLIETAKMNGVNPQEWLTAVLNYIPDHSISKLDELMPWYEKA